MNKINWAQVGVFAAIVLLVFLIGTNLLGGFGGYGGMMGPGMMGGGWGFAPFGWLGALFMWLIPLGFLALIVAGIVWLVRAAGGSSHTGPPVPPAAGACPNCGRPTPADWQHCPYCGQALSEKS
jgi:hypothetical protein